MKKKLFDFRLYTEALRQLRSFAVFSLLPLLFSACYYSLHAISFWASRFNTPELMNENLPIYRSAAALHPYLPHLCLLIAPLLTFRIFFFLNSRKGSDFYHAVPQNRLCLYGSFLAAVWTYLALLVFGSSLISGVCVAWIRPGFIAFRWPELLSFAAGAFCMSLYVSAASACAAALSGTLFTAIITSLLIIFAPRLILYHLAQGIISTGKVLLEDHLFFLVDSRFHLPSVLILKSFGNSVMEQQLPAYLTERSSDLSTFLSAPVQVYTVGITALLAGSGALIFVRRPSETAGLAAVSPRLNSAVGLLLSFLICLKTLLSAVEVLAGTRAYTISLWALVLPVLLLAVLVLFLYQLISTRKLSSLKDALKSLPVLLVMDLLFCGILLLSGSAVRHFRPAAEEIESVRYLGSDFSGQDIDAFFQEETEKADLRSPFLKQLCADGLRTTLDAENDNYLHNGRLLKVAIRVKGRDHYRLIYASEEDCARLTEELLRNGSYIHCYKLLPDADDPRLTLDSDTELSRKVLPSLYQALLKDAAAVSDADWYHLISGEETDIYALNNLHIRFQGNEEIKQMIIPISSRFPSLWKTFWEAREQKAGQVRPLLLTQLERLSRFPVAGSNENVIILTLHTQEKEFAANISFTNSHGTWLINHSEPAETILSELAACLQKESAAPLAPDRPIVEINLSAPQLEADGSSSQQSRLHTFFCAGPDLLSVLEKYVTAPEEPQPMPLN